MYRARICIYSFILFFQSRRKNAVSKKAKKADNLDDLKQELDIDYHKITVEELYQRFSTHPDTVRYFVSNIVTNSSRNSQGVIEK